MAKIDLLSDALNFSEEEQPKKQTANNKKEASFTEADFELDLNLEENVSEEAVEQDSAEEIKNVFESAEPAEETPVKKIKLNFKDEGEVLDEELDSLVMSELEQEEEQEIAPAEDEKPADPGMVSSGAETEPPIEEKKTTLTFNEDEENIVKPNPFYQGKQQEEEVVEEDYEYESFDEDIERGGSSGKRLIFLIIILIVVAAGGYYFMFMNKSGTTSESTLAETPETKDVQSNQNQAVTAELVRKKQQLLSLWQRANTNTRRFTMLLGSIGSISSASVYFTNIRDDGEKLNLTVVAPDRDRLASLNSRLRGIPEIKKIKYLNVSEMNINREIKLVADIELDVAPRSLQSQNINVDQFKSVSIQSLKNYFVQQGIKNLKFEFNVINADPTRPFKTYSCDISGTANYRLIGDVLNTLASRFPQVELRKMNAYSRGFRSLLDTNVKFYLNVTFHEANL